MEDSKTFLQKQIDLKQQAEEGSDELMSGGEEESDGKFNEGGGKHKKKKHRRHKSTPQGKPGVSDQDFLKGQKISKAELKKLEVDLNAFSRDNSFDFESHGMA